MSTSASTTPRFLRLRKIGVPGREGASWLWTNDTTTCRTCSRRWYASNPPAGKDKPIVLEKPTKFNPPSHGSKLPNKSGPRHYGGALSDMEIKAQARRDYPGLPPPPNTYGYWFWNSPKVHAWISIGTLSSLAIYSLTSRFLENSPYGDMMPSLSDFVRHPFDSVQTAWQMLALHIDYNTAEALESRRGSLEDITKRRKYMRAHDIEEQTFAKKILPERFTKTTEGAMDEAYGDESGKEAQEEEPKREQRREQPKEEEKKKTKGWL